MRQLRWRSLRRGAGEADSRLLGAGFAHRFAAQFDAASVVHEAVEDAVGDGGVADLLVPPRYRDLRGADSSPRSQRKYETTILSIAFFPSTLTGNRRGNRVETSPKVAAAIGAKFVTGIQATLALRTHGI